MKTQREIHLEYIIRQTIWMARRYADNRSTYATSMFNEARDLCIDLGIVGLKPDADGSIYARDSMFGDWVPGENRFANNILKEKS